MPGNFCLTGLFHIKKIPLFFYNTISSTTYYILIGVCKYVNLVHCIYYSSQKGVSLGGTEIRVVFGKNVRNYRNRRNWSQADLAEKANISINFIGDIERGNKWPHPDTLSKIADALEIKAFQLFLDEEFHIPKDNMVIMNRLIKDVSLSLNKSLSLSVNQTINNIRKQYNIKPPH